MAPLVSNSKSKVGTASQIARKAKQALANLLQRFGAGSEKVHMQLNAAMVVNSRMSSVPTSVGVGLRMSQSMYVIGQVKASGQIYGGGKVDVKLHPNFNWVQTQKVRNFFPNENFLFLTMRVFMPGKIYKIPFNKYCFNDLFRWKPSPRATAAASAALE